MTSDMSDMQMIQVVKNPLANAGDLKDKGSVPGLGRSPGEGFGNPIQYFCLENPKDRGARWAPRPHDLATEKHQQSNSIMECILVGTARVIFLLMIIRGSFDLSHQISIISLNS